MSVRLAILLILLLPRGSTAQPNLGWLTVDTIMRDPAWMGTSPSQVRWSEDGRFVYFRWRTGSDRGDSLYKVPASGGTPVRVGIVEQREMIPQSGEYNADRTRKVYASDGDIFIADVRSGRVARLTQTIDDERNPDFTANGSAVVYERGGNVYRRDLSSGLERQLTNFQTRGSDREESPTDLQEHLSAQQMELFQVLRERKQEREAREAWREMLRAKRPRPFHLGRRTFSGMKISPDGRYLTFLLTERASGPKRTIVPNYVTDSGFTEDIPARTKVGEPLDRQQFWLYDLTKDTVVQLLPDSLPGIRPAPTDDEKQPRARTVVYGGPVWSIDGKQAVAQVFSQDNKDRWIVMIDLSTGRLGSVIDHQRDEAWVGGPGITRWGNSIGWMPDDKRVWFQSEADGWSHLYVASSDGSERRQLTKGKFEVYGPEISARKDRWYFSSNEVHYGERHFYSMPLEGGTRTRITTREGRNDAELSPDGSMIAVTHSFSNVMPELFIMKNAPGAEMRRVTTSTSEEFLSYDWRAPRILTIPARDGAAIPARLYRPEKPNGAAVIFVHGAGYLQNAHKWWSSYFREYMFHNLLADKGYTVLDLDYRASAGLGRDWRTAIYRFMGGKDLEDNVDGAAWLVKEQGIDPNRIGIYGGSYGGFITLMAMFTKPGVFASGAALRPVTDWAHYNHGYTSNILNIPQEDTVAYRRSSPIYHAEGFQGALLMCHGMVDVNVHAQDPIRLAQRLIELRKENWELALYPVEDHGFTEPTSWMDEYRRILKLFEQTLR